MIDIQLLRDDIEGVAARLAQRGYLLDTAAFSLLECERKSLQTRVQELYTLRNAYSKEVGTAKAKGAVAPAILNKVASLGDELKTVEASFRHVQQELDNWLMSIPNLPHESVPAGQDEQDNLEIRRVGVPRLFDFQVKDHVDIGIPLGLDSDTGAKMSGARFTVLKGELAQLHRVLAQFMLDVHTKKHGYTELYTPYIVNESALRGTGQLPKFSEDMFKVQKGTEDADAALYLISTAEITLTNTVSDCILPCAQLPIKLTAHSPCFRSEAGSYGRDTRGFIRQHQFDKIEMVRIEHPEDSYAALEEMVGHAEYILQALDLPYRVVTLCSGDMGFASAKTYDLEVWLPAQNTYREISSCSNCEAFQARRLKTRVKDSNGKKQPVHTLNGSGLAVGRTLVAILENFQNSDGSVTIPPVLRSYMQKEKLSEGTKQSK